jgi:hypothetical protein
MKKTKLQLIEAKLKEVENELHQWKAGNSTMLCMAHSALTTLGSKNYRGSGLIITIANLSGEPIVHPFLCTNGLTFETITALKKQIEITNNQNLAGSLPSTVGLPEIEE